VLLSALELGYGTPIVCPAHAPVEKGII
jgi:hypothetical protein